MNPRLTRLRTDFESLVQRFERTPRFEVVESEGTPPERYLIRVRVRGLRAPAGAHAEPTVVDEHLVEIFLASTYPRTAPFCRMRTPVFHPNIDPQKICIGDHWSAGQRLVDLVMRIGEMIAYQSYNVKSPLNADAAQWAEEHLDALPIDPGVIAETADA